jgi:RNA polymerase sigma factor (sigma-70 family)
MDLHSLTRRCQALVAEVSESSSWRLPADVQARYAARVTALAAGGEPSDAQLRLMIGYYHSEHVLVEALADRASPEHDRAWELVGAQVRRVLASRTALAQLGDHALSPEDIAQEALADLARGLAQFRYQSRVQTWLFTVVGHCLHRALRSQGAQKRGERRAAQSLEALREVGGEEIAAAQAGGPEEAAQLRLLAELLAGVLARHPDRRLGAIVQLWLVEELPLRQIGQRLELSVGRVHALLGQALDLIRADAGLQRWVAADGPGGDPAPDSEPIDPRSSLLNA